MKNRAFDHRHYTDWRDPKTLIPYEKNAKIHDEKQIKNLVTSLKRFGWQQDCVVTSDNVLVIGHGRRLAAMRIGCEIPVHRRDLRKHLKRMLAQLRQYDRFQAAARQEVG